MKNFITATIKPPMEPEQPIPSEPEKPLLPTDPDKPFPHIPENPIPNEDPQKPEPGKNHPKKLHPVHINDTPSSYKL